MVGRKCPRNGPGELSEVPAKRGLTGLVKPVQVKSHHSLFLHVKSSPWRLKAEGKETGLRSFSVGIFLQDPPIGTDSRGLM